MKINEITREVHISADDSPTGFQIKASRQAFEILSAGLYSDKVKAIIRELSANAYDSHVQAGKREIPFVVHLPNVLEPFFAVRDDGVGMSEDHIYTLYTTYFQSDKTESNDLVGCLGLGSKSPFSYTEQFTVESRYNGQKTTYNCFINDKGFPAIIKLGSVPTDEVNGVEIKFAVRAADFYEFRSKAALVLGWFNPHPKIIGWSELTLASQEYLIRGEKYGLAKEQRYSQSFIVMGNIAYTMNFHSFRHELLDVEAKIFTWGIDIFADIGEVQVTANREEVSYDKKTVAVIRGHLANAAADLKKEIAKKIEEAPTLWQARRTLHDLRRGFLAPFGGQSGFRDFVYKDKAIEDFVNVKRLDETTAPPLLESFTLRRENYKRDTCEVLFADNRLILINDVERGAYSRVVQYLKDEKIQCAYMLTFANTLQRIKILKETGIGEVGVPVSTLPKPTRHSGGRQRTERATLNEYNYLSGSTTCAEYWKPIDIDLSVGGIYTEINYFRFKYPGKEEFLHPCDLRDLLRLLASFDGGKQVKLYGVRPVDVHKLLRHGDWISLDRFVENVIEKNKHLLREVELSIQACNLHDTKMVVLDGQTFASHSPAGNYVSCLKEAVRCYNSSIARSYSRLLSLVGKTPYSVESGAEGAFALVKHREGIYQLYPLLQYLNWNTSSEFVSVVMDYINILDTQKDIT
jgi:hypothetical protein